MKLTAHFQTHPNGFWVNATFSNGELTLSHRYSLEDELELRAENIKNEDFSERYLITKYLETKQMCLANSGRRFEDETECKEWLESTVTDENIYWRKADD